MTTLTIRGKRVPVKHARSLKLRPVLHPERGGNRYCGPAVVSILTGLDTGQAAALIRAVSGRLSIKGTHSWEVREALAYCGVGMHQATLSRTLGAKRPTLAAWHRDWRKQGRFKDSPVWLVSAGKHWQVIGARQMCCGRVTTIRSIRDKAVGRRAQVNQVFRLDLIPPKLPEQTEGRPGPVLLAQMLNRMFS